MGEQLRHRGTRFGLISIGLAGLLSIGTLAGVAGAQGTEAPGVTHDKVKLGYISSQTGVASPTLSTRTSRARRGSTPRTPRAACNGRKIDLEIIDDQSSGANLTAAQDLVQNRKVFAVINNSALAFLAYRFLKEQRRADDRRRLRRRLLRREGQREHHLGARQRGTP